MAGLGNKGTAINSLVKLLTLLHLKLFCIRRERKDTHKNVQSNTSGTVGGEALLEMRTLPRKVSFWMEVLVIKLDQSYTGKNLIILNICSISLNFILFQRHNIQTFPGKHSLGLYCL